MKDYFDILPTVEMSNLVLKEDVKPSAKFEPAGGHTCTSAGARIY